MDTSLSYKQLKRPIKIGLLFSIFTVLLFEFGVYYYDAPNKGIMYLFLIVCHISMYLGFLQGIKKEPSHSCSREFSVIKILNALFWIALLVAVPKFIIYTGGRILSFNEIVVRMAMSFEDSASLYMEHNLEHVNASGIWRYINWIVVLFSPLHWAYIPLSMYYWKQLNLIRKTGSIFIYFLYCFQFIATGVNVGVFVFVIYFGVIYVLKRNESVKKASRQKRIFNRLFIVVIIVLVVVTLASYFNLTMSSRLGDNVGGSRNINQNSLLWKITPLPLRNLVCYFNSYLAHAYNALAYSFSLPWDSTYGFGYSFYLLDEFDPAQTWLWPRTYNMKMEIAYGWDHWAKWHTPYVWFANDVSHFGVPVVLFILFKFFGSAWRKFKETGNVISFLIFILFVNFVSFISANNQVFQANSNFLAFWFLVILNRLYKNVKWILPSDEKEI